MVKFLGRRWWIITGRHASGRRRSWIIPLQCVVTMCLILLSAVGISAAAAGLCVALLAVASLASATQDIATDGMAAEHVSGELLSRVNAIQIAGVMSGFFVGRAGMMMLSARVGAVGALLAMAIFPPSACWRLAASDNTPICRPNAPIRVRPACCARRAVAARRGC